METPTRVEEAKEAVKGVTFGGIMLDISPKMDVGSHKRHPQISKDEHPDIRTEAYHINKAYDRVASDGADVEPMYSEADINRNLKGNNSVGPATFMGRELTQQLGSMASGSNRRYDIKDEVAVRGKVLTQTALNEEMVKQDEVYIPFAPQHQEAAKRAIRALGEKQMRRANARKRHEEVKQAKATLGRAGVKIPKPQPKTEE